MYICNCKKIKTTPMLCKDKITSIFCIINDILKEINHSEDISPAGASLQLVPNSKFRIHNSFPVPPVPLVSPVPALSILPAFSTLSPVPLIPQFIIPLALFRAHYRLKKLFSLWYIKENSRVVLLYCVDF